MVIHPAAPVEGGYNGRTREVTIANLQRHTEIDGYILDGFHNNGATATLLPSTALNALVAGCVSALPADKVRIAFGAYAPATVLQLCAAGVDLFDNSYAYLATKHACALVFDVDAAAEATASEAGPQQSAAFDLDLQDVAYKTDFGPLRRGCECLACTKHTRAYVHHLVMTNELLASILLMM